MASAFIRDGYTEAGYVQAMEGIHPACKFRYRPMTIEQRAELQEKYDNASTRVRANQRQAVALANHVVEWDLEHAGKPVAITPANILTLKWSLFNRMSGIALYGSIASDVDPDNAQKASDDDELELEALIGKGSVNDERAVLLEKN